MNISGLKIAPSLLNHPFYQAWNNGTISTLQLSKYAYSYLDLIKQIPVWWQSIIDSFEIKDQQANNIVLEELEHIDLWKCWIDKLKKPIDYPKLNALIDQIDALDVSEKLGVLYAFEVQQPQIATTKKNGLLKYYGMSEKDLNYFNEHIEEQAHIDLSENILKTYADDSKFRKGFKLGCNLFYQSLDDFMN